MSDLKSRDRCFKPTFEVSATVREAVSRVDPWKIRVIPMVWMCGLLFPFAYNTILTFLLLAALRSVRRDTWHILTELLVVELPKTESRLSRFC